MKSQTKGSRPVKIKHPQWLAIFLVCVCVLLTGHFWSSVEALENDIMPLSSFTGVHTVTLTGPGGYSQTVDIQRFYQGDNSPITFTLDEQTFDDSDIDSVAAALAQDIKNNYQFSVTMDYFAGGNTQFLTIGNVTYEQSTLTDAFGKAHWAIVFQLDFGNDDFSWRDTSFNNSVNIQVLGGEKELGPGEVPDTPPQSYDQVKRWFPADSAQPGQDHERTDDSRYNNWQGLNLNSGNDSSGTVLWGKQVTDERDSEAWNLYTSIADSADFTELENYLNQKYRFLGVFSNWYYEYPAVQWAYDSSLSGVFEVDGIPEVRTAFRTVTKDTFKTANENENELGLSYNTNVAFFLYFVTPPEGIEGITDWIPQTNAAGSKWIEEGKEEKELTEERDSNALDQWDSDNPDTSAFAAWLNDPANGYNKLTVNVDGEGWSAEPYNVTWKFDRETIDVANDLKYYYFKADLGTTVFYGVDGLFGGKSDKTPLKFYLYFSEEYIKPAEDIRNVTGWQVLDPNGGNCGEITTGLLLPEGQAMLPDGTTYFYPTEYIHLSADSAFQNVDDLSSNAFKEEMEQYLADHFYDADGKITYSLKVGFNDNTNSWNTVQIKRITFDAEKTLVENTNANRNYDPNRIVALFKVEVADNYYWGGGASGTPVAFYISVTEAAVTRNPVTDEQVIKDHVVNETNYPNTFGGPIIEQPKGVTVNMFDYWLDGSEAVPNKTGNLDTTPFYNWTSWNVKWETGRSENVFQSGINIGHLLLFGGGNRFRAWQADKSNPNVVGKWNFYTGDPEATNGEGDGNMEGEGGPNYGIVQNKLDNGYPVLNLNDAEKWGTFTPRSAPWSYFGASKSFNGSSWSVPGYNYAATLYEKLPGDASNEGGESRFGAHFDPNNPTNFTAVTQDKLTESLSYLFDPAANTPYRTVYEDVRGMFRLDQAGYYYYNAPADLFEADVNALDKGRTNVYAELDTEQRTDDDGKSFYELTLYDTPYGTQFFPFDKWAKSFEYDEATGNVTANRFEPDQYDTNENEKLIQIDSYANNLNHFFGMTLDATFQQPQNGLVNGEHMVFQFSGDDDVWIYIDGILVGDLGGVHSKSSIEIDYATGMIRIQDRRWDFWTEKSLYEMFAEALDNYPSLADINSGAAELPAGWEMAKAKYVDKNGNESHYPIFLTNTVHELKFFYLERGHEESNLSLSYNFPETQPDRLQKTDEDGNPFPNDNKATFALYEAYRLNGDGEIDLDLSNQFIPSNELAHTSAEFTYDESAPIVDDVTDDIFLGYAELGEETILGKVPLAYTSFNTKFFALVETNTPNGYRTNPPIILQYNEVLDDDGTPIPATLTVVNKYETGAYSSYIAKWTGKVFTDDQTTVSFMTYDPSAGNKPFVTNGTVNRDELASGLTVVIPIIKQTDDSGAAQWYPMYGSNTNGWHTIKPEGNSHANFIEALARAAAMQISVDANTRDWYLTWNDYYQRLEGLMENLPGNATRYLNFNPSNGDMSLIPLYLPEAVLKQIIGRELNGAVDDEDRFKLLKDTLQEKLKNALNMEMDEIKSEEDFEKALDALTQYVDSLNLNGANILDNGRESFNRQPSAVIYIPNEQRELRVRKVDQDGNYVNSAVFAIFDSPENAAKFPDNNKFNNADSAMAKLEESLGKGVVSYGQTADAQINETLIQSGTLIFRENATDPDYKDGTSPITWPSSRTEAEDSDEALPPVLWLKEIYAPNGYVLNENLVRIEVGNSAIYANSTGYDSAGNILKPKSGEVSVKDGITVRAALGKLSQTLVKYAIGNNVDITLQDITIFEQTQNGGTNGALISNGWGGLNESSFNLHYGMNADELTGQYGRHSSDAELPIFVAKDGYIRVIPRQGAGHGESTRRDDLTGINLENLFGLLNIVVMENERLEASMEISKKVEGDAPDADIYQFGIKLTPPEGVTASELSGVYNAYVHKTGHQLPALDENGKQLEIDGNLQYSGPCAPTDMEADGHAKLYLYIDESGEAWVMADKNSDPSDVKNLSRLTLKNSETYVILGLPEGTGFTIAETITVTDDGEYETSVTVDDYLTEDSNYTVTDNNRKVSGVLNSADPDDTDAKVPSVKVQYTNKYITNGESGDPEYGSLSVTKHVQSSTSELPDDEFHFKIVLTGANIARGEFSYIVEQVDGVSFTEPVEQARTDNGLFSSILEFIQNRIIYNVADSSAPLSVGDKETKLGKWINGEFEFVLHGGQRATFSNIPAGASYKVYEETADGWVLVSKSGTDGEIKSGAEAKAEFTNNYQPTRLPNVFDLDVSKTVAGSMGNKADTFTFNLVLSNSEHELADFVQYRKGDETGTLDLKDGHYEFTLMHGETITFIGLPEGTQYTITETGANKYATVITVTESGSSRNVNGKEVTDTLNDNASVSYVNTIDGRVPTNATTVYGWVGAIMITALAVFIIAKRKRAAKGTAR